VPLDKKKWKKSVFAKKKVKNRLNSHITVCGEGNVTVIAEVAQLSHEHYTDPSKAHDMHNVVDKEYFVASAILCPTGVPDVQEIMRLANEFEVPVWPFSIGRKFVFQNSLHTCLLTCLAVLGTEVRPPECQAAWRLTLGEI
jgi:hypothetical protein